MKIIPTPRLIEEKCGNISLKDICCISVAYKSDGRIAKIATKLKNEIEGLTDRTVKLTIGDPDGLSVRIEHGESGEGYTLDRLSAFIRNICIMSERSADGADSTDKSVRNT